MRSYVVLGVLSVWLLLAGGSCGGEEFVAATETGGSGGEGGAAGNSGSGTGLGGGGSDAGNAGSGGQLSCQEGEVLCDGECKLISAFLSDPENCGGCKAKCSAPKGLVAVCSGGQCALGCAPGFELCGGISCVDLQSDPKNCGSCGNICPELPGFKAVCSQGKCSASCLGTLCEGSCVATEKDPKNCGSCGNACDANEVCLNGHCSQNCGSLDACNGSCVDLDTDPDHCGSCETTCPSSAGGTPVCQNGVCTLACEDSRALCGATCVDTSSDPENCNQCGITCPPAPPGATRVCSQGECGFVCNGGKAQCGDTCVDTKSDPANCGGCSNVCPMGYVCSGGVCSLDCSGGKTPCKGACVDTNQNIHHCGACGNACEDPPGHLFPVCSSGKCELACPSGLVECSGECVNLSNSTTHCGQCNQSCQEVPHGNPICAEGKCDFFCTGNRSRCGNTCVDTQTDNNHCGGCSNVCKSGEVCSNGQCKTQCTDGTISCGTKCVNPQTDPENCNGCGNVCAAAKQPIGLHGVGEPTCTNGTCGVVCGPGRKSCKVSSDVYCPQNNSPRFCGVSCTACSLGQVCSAGSCTPPPCAIDKLLCGNQCIDPKIDPKNCGTCGHKCIGSCTNGVCDILSTKLCKSPNKMCDYSGLSICVNTLTDSDNCGDCGKKCSVTQACIGGQCRDYYNAVEPWECSLIPGYPKACKLPGNDPRVLCLPDDVQCDGLGASELGHVLHVRRGLLMATPALAPGLVADTKGNPLEAKALAQLVDDVAVV